MDKTFIISFLSVIVSVVGFIITILILVFKGGAFYNRMNTLSDRVSGVEEDIKKILAKLEQLPILVHKTEQLEDENKEVKKELAQLPILVHRTENLEDTNKQITDTLKVIPIIDFRLNNHDTRLENLEKNLLVQCKNSPYSLTKVGQKIFKDMKGEEFIQKNKECLFAKIDEIKPKSPYDVDIHTYSVCKSLMDDDCFIPIKNFVYYYPMQKADNGEDLDVTLPVACQVLSIPLRDAYLKEHPELDVKQK